MFAPQQDMALAERLFRKAVANPRRDERHWFSVWRAEL
jgi:hypothetical protein